MSQQFKTYVRLAAICGGLLALTALLSRQSHADKPVEVAVVSPIPLPVAGAATGQAIRMKNVDERGRSPYQAYVSCSARSQCAAQGPAVPVGKRLVVEHVSGEFGFAFDSPYRVITLQIDYDHIIPNLLYTYSDTVHYSFASQTVHYFEAGQSPYLLVSVAMNSGPPAVTLNGFISGYLVDLNQ